MSGFFRRLAPATLPLLVLLGPGILCPITARARAERLAPVQTQGPPILNDPDKAYATAEGLYNNNDMDGAIAHLMTALSLRAKFADALLLRGLCWEVKGDYDKAIADFTGAVAIKPDKLYGAYLERGHTYVLTKNYAAAQTDFAKVLEIKPNNQLVHYYRGDAAFAQHLWDKAIAEYTTYIRLAPLETGADRIGIDPSVYKQRGTAYNQVERWKEAASDIDIYLKSMPGDLDALREKGHAYFQVYQATPGYTSPVTDRTLSAAQVALETYDAKKPGDPLVTELLSKIRCLRNNAPPIQ